MTTKDLSTQKRSAIVLSLDDRFVAPAQAMIESIGRHGGALDDAAIVVLVTELSDESTDLLQRSCDRAGLPLSVRVITDVSAMGPVPRWALAACLRLYVGEMCRDFERALYLDADMLILDDLRPLLDVDLEGRTAASVVHYPPLSVMRIAVPRSRRGDADPDGPYFNAGVILFDVERWMSREVGERSRAFLAAYPRTRILDQDALNVALSRDWVVLEKEWDVPAGPLDDAPMLQGLSHMNPGLAEELDDWKAAQERAKILHFVGKPKPWEARYPWAELAARYDEYVTADSASDWPSTEREALSDSNNDQPIREFLRT